MVPADGRPGTGGRISKRYPMLRSWVEAGGASRRSQQPLSGPGWRRASSRRSLPRPSCLPPSQARRRRWPGSIRSAWALGPGFTDACACIRAGDERGGVEWARCDASTRDRPAHPLRRQPHQDSHRRNRSAARGQLGPGTGRGSSPGRLGVRMMVTARPDAGLPEKRNNPRPRCGRRRTRHVPGKAGHRRGLGARDSALASGNWLVVSLLAELVSAPSFGVPGFSASWRSIYDGALSLIGADDSEDLAIPVSADSNGPGCGGDGAGSAHAAIATWRARSLAALPEPEVSATRS